MVRVAFPGKCPEIAAASGTAAFEALYGQIEQYQNGIPGIQKRGPGLVRKPPTMIGSPQ